MGFTDKDAPEPQFSTTIGTLPDQSLETVAVKGNELLMLCLKMEAIFQLHLLQTLGFTQSEVKSVFENSDELQQKLKKPDIKFVVQQ